MFFREIMCVSLCNVGARKRRCSSQECIGKWEAALYAMGDRMGSYRKKNDTEKLKQSLVYFVRKKKKDVERKRIAVPHFHSWSPTGLPLQY